MSEEQEASAGVEDERIVGGRFRLSRLLGRGGMGEVYAAKHVVTGREVALKMILAGAASPDLTRRFMREAKAATAIQHPNVIEVLDVFEDGGMPVMVMELLHGESLAEVRRRAGAMSLHEMAVLLLPVAKAVKAAHDKGIVHRDLKPDNIFISDTPSGKVPKVLDFGIAKVLDPTQISSETQGGNTNTGSLLGTPHYMSLEQAMSEKTVDQRADIWAFGVIVFELLTGRRPIEFETLGQMYTGFLQGTVPKVRERIPDLPEDFAIVLDHCLAKEREGRLADLGPMIEVLGRYTDPSVKGARAGGAVLTASTLSIAVTSRTSGGSTPSARPSRRSWIVLIAAALAIGGVAALALSLNGRGKATPSAGEELAPASSPVAASPSSPAASPAPSASATIAAAITAAPSPSPDISASARASSTPISKPLLAPPAPMKSVAPIATAAPLSPPAKGIVDKLPY